MALRAEIGIAKVNKYASRESGDTVEVVERPLGGMTAVLIDGQGSGPGAKALSMLLTAKAVALLKEGVRDGAVARAVHDVLFVARGGKVSAALDLLTVDARSGVVLLTRNSASPVVACMHGLPQLLVAERGPIGTSSFARPSVVSLPLAAGLVVWVVSDGIVGAGRKYGREPVDLASTCARLVADHSTAQSRADALLDVAVELDQGRPADDMSVIILDVGEVDRSLPIRRMTVLMPIEGMGRGR